MDRCGAVRFVGAVFLVLSGCTPSPSSPPATTAAAPPVRDLLVDAYERGVRAAAVRDPSFAVDLRTIPPGESEVTVATFTEWGAPPSPTQRPIWVSLPDQLRALCRGKPDPVLAIQEALGLPPQSAPSRPEHQWQVFSFSLPRAALFRPCPGGTDVAAPRCASTLAPEASPAAHGPGLDPATERFLLDQLWSSDRVGFRATNGAPDWGYPFTGMGWTYNWDPQAATPIGVSEFVVRNKAPLTAISGTPPAAFCNAPGSQ